MFCIASPTPRQDRHRNSIPIHHLHAGSAVQIRQLCSAIGQPRNSETELDGGYSVSARARFMFCIASPTPRKVIHRKFMLLHHLRATLMLARQTRRKTWGLQCLPCTKTSPRKMETELEGGYSVSTRTRFIFCIASPTPRQDRHRNSIPLHHLHAGSAVQIRQLCSAIC